MTNGMRRSPILAWVIAIVVIGAAGSARAQSADALARSKQLYADAAYEDALKALESADGPEVQQYRALCLLALGRTSEVESVMASLVSAAPAFTVAEQDVPPRFFAMFANVRQRTLPTVVRDRFSKGREQFRAKSFAAALEQFEDVLELSADPLVRNDPDVADVRLLAAGFVDLIRETEAPAPPPPAPVAERPATNGAPAAAAAVAPPMPTPAVAIRQDVPGWPRGAGPIELATPGVVRLHIGADGKVKAATIEASIHPLYDKMLLLAARGWTYQPATLAGKPIDSDRLVRIELGGGNE